jgi:hypothetical protein
MLYMVTFTINIYIPQMLAYIYRTWILWARVHNSSCRVDMSCFGVVWILRTRLSIFNFEHWNFTPLWKFGKRADFETSRKWCSKWSSRIYVLFLFRVQRYIVGPCKDGIHATWSSTERSSASRSLQVSWKCRVCNDFVGTLSLEPQKNHGWW